MERIGHIIKRCFVELGIDRPIQQYKALSLWPVVVGERLSQVTQPNHIENGKIFIKVDNALWRNEIIFYKEEIIQKMNEELGSRLVEDIIFM